MKLDRTTQLYYILKDAYFFEAQRRVMEDLPPQDEFVLVLHRVMKKIGAVWVAEEQSWVFSGEAGTAFALQYYDLLNIEYGPLYAAARKNAKRDFSEYFEPEHC